MDKKRVKNDVGKRKNSERARKFAAFLPEKLCENARKVVICGHFRTFLRAFSHSFEGFSHSFAGICGQKRVKFASTFTIDAWKVPSCGGFNSA